MVKKLSVLALAGMFCLPTVASAASADQLADRIEQLTRELNTLKQEMGTLQEETQAALEENKEKVDEAARFQLSGDFRSRLDYVSADTPAFYTASAVSGGVADFFTLNDNFGTAANNQGPLSADGLASFMGATIGDMLAGTAAANALNDMGAILTSGTMSNTEVNTMMTMMPMLDQNMTMGQLAGELGTTLANRANIQPVAAYMRDTFTAGQRNEIFNALGYTTAAASSYENDTMWTNRFRLNLRAKATENVTFKGRLAMYKAWGMQNNPVDYSLQGGPFMLSSLAFDGSSTRQPQDSVVRVDRAYVNWTNVADLPMWFSIGRRPTTDGPPGQYRQGVDQRMATPTAFMDYPFDGLTLGYAYENLFGMDDFPGRIRFCYGRGFEAGPTENGDGLNDVDFAGISWDVYEKEDRFFAFQSFVAFNMFNVPDNITFANPMEMALNGYDDDFNGTVGSTAYGNNILDRTNLGDIYHTTAVYQDKADALNYFVSLGWSHTDPRDMARGMDEMGTSLLGSFWETPESKDGYAVYTGIRYDMDAVKLGLEFNYGSENWIGFTPGHDDIYSSKLAARGYAAEAYVVYDLPAGDKLSKFADFFMRLGYIHINYDYTGSGFWIGTPIDIDELKNDPLNAQFYTPVDKVDQVYLTLDTYF